MTWEGVAIGGLSLLLAFLIGGKAGSLFKVSKKSKGTPEELSKRRVVGCFWDIENLQVPTGVDAGCLGIALQDLARQLSGEDSSLEFLNAYIDTKQLGSSNANALSQVGVSLIHSPIAKEAADKAIIVDLLMWLWQWERNNAKHVREPCVILITRDHDFEPMLYKLKNQREVHVVLVTDISQVRPQFLNSPSEVFDWKEILDNASEIQNNLKKKSVTRGKKAPSDTNVNPVDVIEVSTLNREYSNNSDCSERSTKSLKKRFTSTISQAPSKNEQIADIILVLLQSRSIDFKLSEVGILNACKNPAFGGGPVLFEYIKMNDLCVFDILRKYEDRFSIIVQRNGRQLASLIEGHEILPFIPGNGSNDTNDSNKFSRSNSLKWT